MALGRKRNEEKALDCRKIRLPLPKNRTTAATAINGKSRSGAGSSKELGYRKATAQAPGGGSANDAKKYRLTLARG
jgi:hypothetical protein